MAESQIINDGKKWADLEAEIVTIKGEKVRYFKKLSLGKELKIRAIFNEKLSPLLSRLEGEDAEEKAFSFMLTEFPALLPTISAIILEKDEEWVLENIDKSTAEEIVSPFLQDYFQLPKFLERIPPELLKQLSQK